MGTKYKKHAFLNYAYNNIIISSLTKSSLLHDFLTDISVK